MSHSSPAGRRAWLAGLLLLAAAGSALAATSSKPLPFKPIKTSADLDRELASAVSARRVVMLWVRADWAISGLEMESKTFTDPDVIKATEGLTLLQADVTHFDSEDKALIARLDLVGAPAVLFYGVDGAERRNFRVFPIMKAGAFAAMIRAAAAPVTSKAP